MKQLNSKLWLFALLFSSACGQVENAGGDLQEAWDQKNRPEIISGKDYLTELDDLPKKFKVSQNVWSGDYWANKRGGIAFRWLIGQNHYKPFDLDYLKASTTSLTAWLSPAEKYDLYLGRYDFPLVAKERQRTKLFKTFTTHNEYDPTFEIPNWIGLCHGWAPAALNFDEPKKVIVKNRAGLEIEFGSSDIKALLTYFHQHDPTATYTSFMSRRCNENFAELAKKKEAGELTEAQLLEKMESRACRDVNAGSFHLVLANEIGIKQKGFIVDITRDAQVWNQPVVGFDSEIGERRNEVSDGASPEAVQEVEVKTTMTYVVERSASSRRVGSVTREKKYHYVLELDKEGAIVGGRWNSKDRPDFVWRQSKPEFTGEFLALKDLYEQSIKDE